MRLSPNPALQRTRPVRSGCNRRVSWAGSLGVHGGTVTMRSKFTVVALVVCGLSLTGCILPVPWPGKTETSPAIGGHITDALSKQPVTGASVQIRDRSDTATTSDSDGDFHVAAVREFYLMRFVTPCPVYYFPSVRDQSYTVEIAHPDYETIQFQSYDRWILRNAPCTNWSSKEIVLEDIKLVPKSK